MGKIHKTTDSECENSARQWSLKEGKQARSALQLLSWLSGESPRWGREKDPEGAWGHPELRIQSRESKNPDWIEFTTQSTGEERVAWRVFLRVAEGSLKSSMTADQHIHAMKLLKAREGTTWKNQRNNLHSSHRSATVYVPKSQTGKAS